MTSHVGRNVAIGLAVTVVLFVGATLLAVSSAYSRKPLDAYVAKEKAAGKPVTVREVLGPDPQAETNGAPDLIAVWNATQARKGEPDAWNVDGPWNATDGRWDDALTDEKRRALDAALADAKPLFDAVAAAVAKPHLRLATGDGENVAESAISLARVVSVLCARSIAAADPKDRLAATELLADVALRAECRGMIDAWVASLAMRDAAEAVQRGLERGDIDVATWRARLDERMQRRWLPLFADVVRLERARVLELAQSYPFDDTGRLVSGMPPRSPTQTVRSRVEDLIAAWRRGESTPRDSPAHFAETLAAREPFERATTDSFPRLMRAIGDAASQLSDRTVMQPLSRTATVLTQTDACCRLARIALAAAEFRAKTGDFPASLDELKTSLGGDAPLDPYTDAPFVYEKRDAGVVLSSRGRLPDDPPTDESLDAKGLVWRLRR